MRKMRAAVLGGVFAFEAVCLIYSFIYRFSNPKKTETQLFLALWFVWLLMLVGMVVSIAFGCWRDR